MWKWTRGSQGGASSAPVTGDPQFEIAMNLVTNSPMLPNITAGATHYFNPNVVLPSWAAKMTKVASIGHHDFYK